MALWTVHGDGRITDSETVAPQERVSWPLTIGFGVQHLVAMFGATVLVPTATGLPVGTTLLFSGLGTLLFLLITKNRVPSYLGSSFAFVAPLVAAREQGIAAQLGGVVAAGLLVIVVGIAVKALGVRLLESVMPPVVTGAVVIIIGLNLSHQATADFAEQPLLAAITTGVILLAGRARPRPGVPVLDPDRLRRRVDGRPVFGAVSPSGVAALREAAWVGLPQLQQPELRPVRRAADAARRDRPGRRGRRPREGRRGVDRPQPRRQRGRRDHRERPLHGAGRPGRRRRDDDVLREHRRDGRDPRVHDRGLRVRRHRSSMLLAFSPKAIALFGTIPPGVLGGCTLVLYGLIVLVGVRIWMDRGVDLTNPVNAMVGGAALVAGVGDLTIEIGELQMGGLVWGSLLVVILHPVMRWLRAARQ